MTPDLLLKRSGLRWTVALVIVALGLLPNVPLIWRAFQASEFPNPLQGAFGQSLLTSLSLAIGVALSSVFMGLTLGVLVALYKFPLRLPLVYLQALPLLLPSFLWAIGWSALRSRVPLLSGILEGYPGCLITFALQATPLVFFSTLAGTNVISATQVDAARLAGGEGLAIRLTLRACLPLAALASMLAGVLSLSDPGPALILGLPVAAVQILTSFSALYDFGLASRQCLVIAGLVCCIFLPIAVVGLPRLSAALLARQTQPLRCQSHSGGSPAALGAILLFSLLSVGLPLAGLVIPALQNPVLGRALEEVKRTALNTGLYAVSAGVLCATLGAILALAISRDRPLQQVCFGILLLTLALPATLPALGLVEVGTRAPPAFDLLLRSRFSTIWLLGWRLLPVATIILLKVWQSASPSWTEVAALHRIPFSQYLTYVVVSWLKPAWIGAVVVCAILSNADISTVLLTHPPGQMSLTVALFTVMANSPENLVASLCLVEIVLVTLILGLTPALLSRLERAE